MSASKTRQRLLAARPVRASAEELGAIARPLPEDCPVIPLGMAQGPIPTAVYLSGSGVLSQLSGQAHGQGNLEGLFAPRNQFLWQHWPRKNKRGEVDGFKTELVRADLMAAAGQRDIWNEMDRVRGRGAWLAEDGGLLLHLGDRLLHNGQIKPWGEHGGMVYPAGAAMLGPAPEPQPDGPSGPAAEVLAMLHTWNWRHGDVAARVMLGWICAAMIGGALKWRPAVWPTGGTGTGKSTLITAVKHMLGPQGALATAQTTEAGVRQVLGFQSIPTLLDELEADEMQPEKIQKLIGMIRVASSGAVATRGGSDHTARQFTIMTAPMATSIMVPPLPSQDRTRIAVLELRTLTGETAKPDLAVARLQALGQRLLRRLVDGWGEFGERLTTWRAQLHAHMQMDDRAQDQWGTLLACADLALHDQAPDGDLLDEWVGPGMREMLAEMGADDETDWRRALDHLLTATADSYRGGDRLTVGELVARAAGMRPADDGDEAQRALNGLGLRVDFTNQVWWLGVANQHQALGRIYQHSIWAGRSNTTGGWRQVLMRVPGAKVPANALRFGSGHQQRGVFVPLLMALNAA